MKRKFGVKPHSLWDVWGTRGLAREHNTSMDNFKRVWITLVIISVIYVIKNYANRKI